MAAVDGTSSSHGISILEEIFPESCQDKGQSPLLQQLGRIPTPARYSAVPLTAPPVASMVPLQAPSMPPPPQQPPLITLPTAACQPTQPSWDASYAAHAPMCAAPFASYREKLRAGGRGALQRAIGAGLMPKNMKQEWSLQQDTTMHVNDVSQQQPHGQNSTYESSPMSYVMPANSNPGWNAVASAQGDPCWHMQIEQNQMPAPYPNSNMQAMYQPADAGRMPCNPQYPQQMMPAQPPQQPQMGVPQMQVQQVQLPQAQMPVTHGGDATPTELQRCMAIVMPDTCDKDMMVAQLRAAADCQRYED